MLYYYTVGFCPCQEVAGLFWKKSPQPVKPLDGAITPEQLQQGEIPRHIAIVMDGNGRWAKERNLPRIMGHKEGVNALREIIRAASHWGWKP